MRHSAFLGLDSESTPNAFDWLVYYGVLELEARRRRRIKIQQTTWYNDLLNFAMRLACIEFSGDSPDMFNLACLSSALQKITGIRGEIDGDLLRVILIGRPDVEQLSGGCHYRLKA